VSFDRLPAHLEVASILRRAEAAGGFGTVLRKGDPERGSILLLISRRGQHLQCLERIMSLAGGYSWQASGPPESAGSAEIADFLAKRARFDEDYWALELDIADPERFIAETTGLG
jgi:hypothetical protein